MGAFIVRPLEEERATNPVEIEISYDFAVQTNVVRQVAGDADGGTLLQHQGTDIKSVNTMSGGRQRVVIKDGAVELNAQENVYITGVRPVVIEAAPMEVTGDGSRVVLVKGTCDQATLPEHPFVLCVIYSFNPNGVRTAVTIGFDVPDDKLKWQVKLQFKPRPNTIYVVRAFLLDYQNPFTIVGATTRKLLP
jgi:hypothetical protein